MGKWECRRRALLGGGESAIHADGPASDPTLLGRGIEVQGNMTGLLEYATLFSTNANDFLLTAPVGDTGEGASVDATAAGHGSFELGGRIARAARARRRSDTAGAVSAVAGSRS